MKEKCKLCRKSNENDTNFFLVQVPIRVSFGAIVSIYMKEFEQSSKIRLIRATTELD